MTAIRVVDRYVDLADVPSGSYTPTQINYYIDQVASGSVSASGSGDPFASYIVLSPTSSLPNARQIVTGSGIVMADDPISGTLTISVDPSYVRSLIRWNEVPAGTIDGSNTIFQIDDPPNPSSALMLYYNGQLLDQGIGNDFILSGTTITMAFAPIPPDKFKATYPK